MGELFNHYFNKALNGLTALDGVLEEDQKQQNSRNFREMLSLNEKLSVLSNPMTMLTPILVTGMIVLGVLAMGCICACGFCWYWRYNRTNERNDLENRRDSRDSEPFLFP